MVVVESAAAMKARKPDGSRWFTPTPAELMDRWLLEPQLLDWLRSAIEFSSRDLQEARATLPELVKMIDSLTAQLVVTASLGQDPLLSRIFEAVQEARATLPELVKMIDSLTAQLVATASFGQDPLLSRILEAAREENQRLEVEPRSLLGTGRASFELLAVRDAATGEALRVLPGNPPTVVDHRLAGVPFTATFIGSKGSKSN
jgi:hypothetical protein